MARLRLPSPHHEETPSFYGLRWSISLINAEDILQLKAEKNFSPEIRTENLKAGSHLGIGGCGSRERGGRGVVRHSRGGGEPGTGRTHNTKAGGSRKLWSVTLSRGHYHNTNQDGRDCHGAMETTMRS